MPSRTLPFLIKVFRTCLSGRPSKDNHNLCGEISACTNEVCKCECFMPIYDYKADATWTHFEIIESDERWLEEEMEIEECFTIIF
ncbi:hypothetical protein chiPu_0011757 [Chiloscyllium punctatum]|uniref:Uncharacterized protein n=1 Tax=Chiloscyllium punctatum TaxID=137246 RepID=A0A401SSB8_CHIPU|nr:hypothetical protein [Chiloscyllium punctatum]